MINIMSSFCCVSTPISRIDMEKENQASLRLQFILSFCCLAAFGSAWLGSPAIPKKIEGFLYIIAYVAGGFFPACGVLVDLRLFRFNVNFLMVAAALGAALIGQTVEGAILMFLFSLSGALENFASGKTRKAIRSLMKLSPSEAKILRDDKEET